MIEYTGSFIISRDTTIDAYSIYDQLISDYISEKYYLSFSISPTILYTASVIN